MQEQENIQTEEIKTYPTAPNAEGFYYEDEGMEACGIMTKEYENENKVHRVVIGKGRVAIVRELIGTEGMKSQKIGGKDEYKIQVAMAALATKIDENEFPMEELLKLKSKDLNKLVMASNLLNFL